MKSKMWQVFVRICNRYCLWVLVALYAFVTKEYNSTGSPTVLALNHVRFRGDLELLAEEGFRVLTIPIGWQYRLQPSREFMHRFVKKLGIDCIITAKVNYRQDKPWVFGAPWVALHRECAFVSAPALIDVYRNRYEGRQFLGEHIIVHSEAARQVFIETGYVEPNKISALGCMRMDGLRPLVTLFSFSVGAGLLGKVSSHFPQKGGMPRLFEAVHRRFVETARKNPWADFVIKTKWGGNWHEAIRKVVDVGLPNLSLIAEEGDTHDLIMKSNVVVAFQSTAMVEALAMQKRVVVPLFHEAVLPENGSYLRFRDCYQQCFLVSNEDEMEAIIINSIQFPESFRRYVSWPGACKRYAKLIRGIL